MSEILKTTSVFDRLSFVVMDDSLVRLEHGSTQDRVRKFRFIEIEGILFSRAAPVGRLILCTVFFILPGIAMMLLNSELALVMVGLGLMVVGLCLLVWYSVAGRTTIQIYRANRPTPEKVSGIFRPRKVRRFRENLIAGIQRAQSAAALRDAGTVQAPEVPALDLTPPPIPPV
jgi:hypothetical protein